MAKQTIQVADKPTLDAILAKMNTMASTIENLSSKIETLEGMSDKYAVNNLTIESFSKGGTITIAKDSPIMVHAIYQNDDGYINNLHSAYKVYLNNELLFDITINCKIAYMSTNLVSALKGNKYGSSTTICPPFIHANMNGVQVYSHKDPHPDKLTIFSKGFTASECSVCDGGIYVPAGSTLKIANTHSNSAITAVFVAYKELV